jgi:probable addiction module antidote protein
MKIVVYSTSTGKSPFYEWQNKLERNTRAIIRTLQKQSAIGLNVRIYQMNKKLIDYQEKLLQDLQNPKEAIAYLNASLIDEDPRIFLLALKNVVAAQGKIATIAKKTKLNRENLYRMLSKKGNPKLSSIVPVLNVLGFHLSVQQYDK